MSHTTVDLDDVERLLQELLDVDDDNKSKRLKKKKQAENDAAPAPSTAVQAALQHRPSRAEFNSWSAPDPPDFMVDDEDSGIFDTLTASTPAATEPPSARFSALASAIVSPRRQSAIVSPVSPPPEIFASRDVVTPATVERPESEPVASVVLLPTVRCEAMPVSLGSMAPRAVTFGHAAAVVDGVLVTFGGSTATAAATNVCHEFHVATSLSQPAFASRGDVPAARTGHTAVTIGGGAMFVFGGRGGDGGMLGDVHAYELAEQRWIAIEATGKLLPAARAGHSAVAVGKRMIIFGGRSTDAAKRATVYHDVFALDTTKSVWHKWATKGSAAPATVAPAQQAGTDGGDSDGGDADGADALQTQSSAAVATTAAPCKRHGHAACVSSDKSVMFISGGDGPNGPLDDLWGLTLSTKRWRRYAVNRSVPRSRHALLCVGAHLLVLGGAPVAAAGGAAGVFAASAKLSELDSAAPAKWAPHRMLGRLGTVAATRHSFAAVEHAGFVYLLGGYDASPGSAPQLACVSRFFACEPSVPDAAQLTLRRMRRLLAATRQHDVCMMVGGTTVTAYRFILEARAPAFAAALRRCDHDEDAGGGRDASKQGEAGGTVARYVLEGNRRRHGLCSPAGMPFAVGAAALGAFVEYLHTGRLSQWTSTATTADDGQAIAAGLMPLATAFKVAHLERYLNTRLDPTATGASPAVLCAEADAVSDALVCETLVELIDDTMTCDASVDLAAGTRDADPAVGVHAAVVMNACELLRRVMAPVAQRQRPSCSTTSTRGAVITCDGAATADAVTLAVKGVQLPRGSVAKAVLRYLYVGEVDGITGDNAMEVIGVADRLGLDTLKGAAAAIVVRSWAFVSMVESSPLSLCDMLSLALHHGCGALVEVTVARIVGHCVRNGSPAVAEVRRLDSFNSLPIDIQHDIAAMVGC
jgi:N-acetylneuraminic acid mutarotase